MDKALQAGKDYAARGGQWPYSEAHGRNFTDGEFAAFIKGYTDYLHISYGN